MVDFLQEENDNWVSLKVIVTYHVTLHVARRVT